MDILQRFLLKVRPVESGCHEWQSTLHRGGYGKFWFNGGQIQAHRMAYMLHVGEIPEGEWVLHKCDNRKCVNPEHLYLGDAKQNSKDRTDRGRWWVRIPAEVVAEVRRRYSSESISQQRLADEYGIDQTSVSRFVLGRERIRK